MCCILYATEQTAMQTVVKAVSARAKYTRLRKHTLATNTHTRTLSAITINLLLIMAFFLLCSFTNFHRLTKSIQIQIDILYVKESCIIFSLLLILT